MPILAIDFENATSARNSACEIGVTQIDNGEITASRSWLIRPPCWPNFDFYNVRLHGISPKMVANEPTFDEIWQEVQHWFAGRVIIAHNAAFDIGVLRDMLTAYNIAIPDNPYLCTYRLARKVWPDLGKFGLKTMIRHLQLDLGKQHRAEYDSKACAGVLIHAMTKYNVDTIQDLALKTDTSLRTISQFGHDAPVNQSREIPIGDPSLFLPDHVLFDKTIAFSGTLESMSRAQAWQKVANIGAIIVEKVDSRTDILVIGQHDGKKTGVDGYTGKHRHALRLIDKGIDIQLMSETEFLALLPG